MEVRMSLAEAAALTNTAPNTMRSRFKSGKIRGERDNTGKIWVWINPDLVGSTKRASKPSKGSNNAAVEALTAQLERAHDELETLRPRAAMAERLEAERPFLLGQVEDLKADRDAWRQLSERRGFWRLFRR
jgi:hypothetical protein